MPHYRLAILNDCECPEPRMVIVTRELQDGVHEWAYLSAWRDLDHHRGWRPLRFPERVTELETFGVAPVIELFEGEHTLRVEEIGPSRATYSDGKPRKWQHQLGKRTVVLPDKVPILAAYTLQARPSQPQGGAGNGA